MQYINIPWLLSLGALKLSCLILLAQKMITVGIVRLMKALLKNVFSEIISFRNFYMRIVE